MENALRFERSPYLLQHKSNPVYWLPWGEEARRRALEEDKPMLVSVGYAACHWCHVMAEESFSDPRTAALMNELFVNVKVDREERPDVDAFCVRALQAMGKRPGWPLTIFMTPDGRPFWGGTYFPPEDRGELPAFATVLQKIGELYRSDHATVLARAESFIGAFAHADGGSDGDVTAELVLEAAEELLSNIDMNHGGLKGAPKFPFPPLLRFLWSMGARQGRSDFQDAVVATLDGMLDGGIYDQLGGGFARYAVDEQWLVPHFEKMLYDNAQLIAVLAELWRVKRVPRYAQAVRQTIDWVTREMTLAGGAFASSLGAVSEGGEGRFYLWHEKEVNVLLGPDAALFKRVYGVTAQGNFQGRNVLNRASAPSDFDVQQERILERCRAVLLEARGSRPRPQRDEKILADWNGLAIHALAKAALILDEPAWLDRGRSAFDFIVRELCVDGTLHHAWCDGSLQKTRVLDDYAQMSRAAVALYEATAEHEYLEHCERWVNVALSLFADDHSGALAFSADATLAARIVDGRDTAMPSGNGTLCEVLARLFYLTGDERYRSRCKRVVGSFVGRVGEDGFQLATLFDAALQLTSAAQVIVTGARDDASTRALSRAAYELAPPDSLIVTLAPSSRVPGALAAKAAAAQVPTAYVCVGTTCLEPAHNASELRRVLAGVFPSH